MVNTRSGGRILVGLAAVAGAFGVAATLSAATAPTARADDFSAIVSAVDNDYSLGQTYYDAALTDFGNNELSDGLQAFFAGVNNDALAAPNNVLIGLVDELTNQTFITDETYGELIPPASLADALTDAQQAISAGESDFALAATDLSSADYGDATIYGTLALDDVSVIPAEYVLWGAALGL